MTAPTSTDLTALQETVSQDPQLASLAAACWAEGHAAGLADADSGDTTPNPFPAADAPASAGSWHDLLSGGK